VFDREAVECEAIECRKLTNVYLFLLWRRVASSRSIFASNSQQCAPGINASNATSCS